MRHIESVLKGIPIDGIQFAGIAVIDGKFNHFVYLPS
jgi:hypothetical protein